MFLKVKSLPWNSVFYGQKYECMWDIENHSKSYIYFESRILIKMYHDNHNKIEETAGKQNSQNKCDMQKEKKMVDMSVFENINFEMSLNIRLVNTDSLKVFSKSYN